MQSQASAAPSVALDAVIPVTVGALSYLKNSTFILPLLVSTS
jgi:hypothetical protein